jgi:hypothetical protein
LPLGGWLPEEYSGCEEEFSCGFDAPLIYLKHTGNPRSFTPTVRSTSPISVVKASKKMTKHSRDFNPPTLLGDHSNHPARHGNLTTVVLHKIQSVIEFI